MFVTILDVLVFVVFAGLVIAAYVYIRNIARERLTKQFILHSAYSVSGRQELRYEGMAVVVDEEHGSRAPRPADFDEDTIDDVVRWNHYAGEKLSWGWPVMLLLTSYRIKKALEISQITFDIRNKWEVGQEDLTVDAIVHPSIDDLEEAVEDMAESAQDDDVKENDAQHDNAENAAISEDSNTSTDGHTLHETPDNTVEIITQSIPILSQHEDQDTVSTDPVHYEEVPVGSIKHNEHIQTVADHILEELPEEHDPNATVEYDTSAEVQDNTATEIFDEPAVIVSPPPPPVAVNGNNNSNGTTQETVYNTSKNVDNSDVEREVKDTVDSVEDVSMNSNGTTLDVDAVDDIEHAETVYNVNTPEGLKQWLKTTEKLTKQMQREQQIAAESAALKEKVAGEKARGFLK